MANKVRKSRWQPILLGFFILVLVFTTIVLKGPSPSWPDWTGFGAYSTRKTATETVISSTESTNTTVTVAEETHREKTLWDWMELLIVPIVLVAGGFLLNRSQRQSEQNIAERQRRQDQELAEKVRTQELEIAQNREEEGVLQSYFGVMTELLLERELRSSKQDSEVRDIARSRTLTALRRLKDGNRKGSVLRFLHETKLIHLENTIIDLRSALLLKAYLSKADLSGANLRRVNMYRAKMDRANLQGANLQRAILQGADLKGANLKGVALDEAHLQGAELQTARYDKNTKWPKGFDYRNAGAIEEV